MIVYAVPLFLASTVGGRGTAKKIVAKCPMIVTGTDTPMLVRNVTSLLQPPVLCNVFVHQISSNVKSQDEHCNLEYSIS